MCRDTLDTLLQEVVNILSIKVSEQCVSTTYMTQRSGEEHSEHQTGSAQELTKTTLFTSHM